MDIDKISNLPVDLTDAILSKLPITEAVRTCVLSRKWRYKWATLPHLIFDTKLVICVRRRLVNNKDVTTFDQDKFVKIIDHVLLLHTGSILQFVLRHEYFQAVTNIDRWILYLSRSSLKEFVLEIWRGERYKLPSTIYACQSLIHLKLCHCSFGPPLTLNGFPCLLSLDLDHITMTQHAFENLISSCPLLKSLTLGNFDGFRHLNIHAPSLEVFNIGGDFDEVSLENTLSLTEVYIQMDNDPDDYLPHDYSCNLLKFFTHLPHVRRLEFHNYFLKYLAFGDVPKRLPRQCLGLNYLYMWMNFNDWEENLAALCLLRSSPNLEELVVLAREVKEEVENDTNFCEQVHLDFPFTKLRCVKIVGISGVEAELNFIGFLLANSPVLETMTVELASIDRGWELLKGMLCFSRVSVRAKIVVVEP